MNKPCSVTSRAHQRYQAADGCHLITREWTRGWFKIQQHAEPRGLIQRREVPIGVEFVGRLVLLVELLPHFLAKIRWLAGKLGGVIDSCALAAG
jgi:hypothetical protein